MLALYLRTVEGQEAIVNKLMLGTRVIDTEASATGHKFGTIIKDIGNGQKQFGAVLTRINSEMRAGQCSLCDAWDAWDQLQTRGISDDLN
jgi:hypothetical protein